jgi:aldehyde dehydrogenase (NAD+)
MSGTPPAAASDTVSSNGSPNSHATDAKAAPDMSAFSAVLDATYARLQAGLKKNARGYEWRMEQLRQLKRMIEENENEIFEALWKDLRKGKFECQATEQGVVISEINDALKNLKSWMKIKRVGTALYNWPGRSLIYHEPYGLTLILGAWNYPFQLTIAPLVGAIVGGNACLIKPPDMTPATSAMMTRLIPKYLDPDLFAVHEGGQPEIELILKKKFDLMFFTGGTTVAQVVMRAAVPNLTPVILELGGKSPAVVMKDADLKVTARRLAWGKFMNAGQTCIAPDYLIVDPEIKDELIREMKSCLEDFYGKDAQKSPDYCRIVNTRAFDRLVKLTDGSTVLVGGKSNRDDLYIEPTILASTGESEAMKAEVFGPILPVVELADPSQIIDFINGRPKPLALYLFTRESSMKDRFMHETTSGSLVVNDVVIHMPEPGLPFGGVGMSGMGNYHGKFSFDSFTHAKGVLRKTYSLDLPIRYAPYTDQKARIMKWLFS